MAGKQAKILSPAQEAAMLLYARREHGRHTARDVTIVLLSVKAGLRAKEISELTWAMVTDPEGAVGVSIELQDRISKGGRKSRGGRTIPLHRDLQAALVTLKAQGENDPEQRIILSRFGVPLSAGTVADWFWRAYKALGFDGCSSHSGRRTFITRAAKRCVAAGGSLRDVQQLAGHKSLNTTQGYIEGDSDAKKKIVEGI